MAYGEAQSSTAPSPPPSLLGDSARLIERLSELLGRSIKVGNSLHGSQPRDASGGKPESIQPEPTLRRNLDKALSILCDIEGELSRIEGRL